PTRLPPPTSTLFPYTTLFRSTIAPTRHTERVPGGDVDRLAVGGDAAGRPDSSALRPCRPRVRRSRVGNRHPYHPSVVVSAIPEVDRKSTRLNSSHQIISYAVF